MQRAGKKKGGKEDAFHRVRVLWHTKNYRGMVTLDNQSFSEPLQESEWLFREAALYDTQAN